MIFIVPIVEDKDQSFPPIGKGFCKVRKKHCPLYAVSRYGDFCGQANGKDNGNDIEVMIKRGTQCPLTEDKKKGKRK